MSGASDTQICRAFRVFVLPHRFIRRRISIRRNPPHLAYR